MDGENGARVAEFEMPKPTRIKLPKGTVFPTMHTIRLMRRAALGTTPCQPRNPKPRLLIGKNIIVTASLFVSALNRPAQSGIVA